LLAGAAVALNQADEARAAREVALAERRIAEQERERAESEALLARTEQDRAERRLTQMVGLADKSLNDVHAAIERLPGSMEARRQVVATTLEFLQDLS